MRKILVVDNDAHTLKLFARLFQGKSIALTLTSKGKEAKRLYEENDYNLVLMDQDLPDINGLALIEWMRAERPKQVAILLTGFSDVREAVEAVRSGLFAFFSKPFKNLEALEALIEKGLELDWAYREIKRLKTALKHCETDSEPIDLEPDEIH